MANKAEVCFFQGSNCRCNRFPRGANASAPIDYSISVEPEILICQGAGDGEAQRENCTDYVPESRPNLVNRINRITSQATQGII